MTERRGQTAAHSSASVSAEKPTAPVAGAVDALKLARPFLQAHRDYCVQTHGIAGRMDDILATVDAAIAQPAPAVAVEAERERFNDWRLSRSYGTGGEWDAWQARAALAARSAPAVAESQWMPIETAPKNHLPVLTWSKLDGVRAAFRDVTWRWLFVMPTTSARPTHWSPLPAPPTVGSGSAQEGQAK